MPYTENILLNLQQCLLSLRSGFLHNGLALNSDKTEVTCLGTTHRRQSLSSLTTIQVFDASVSLSDRIKLLGIALDSRLNFDKHVSNVCSISYFHIRVLRHIRSFLDLESCKSIACAIVSSRLDYANSCLSVDHLLLQYPPTTESSTLPCPRWQLNPPSLILCLARYTCLSSLAAYPSASHFQACRPSLP